MIIPLSACQAIPEVFNSRLCYSKKTQAGSRERPHRWSEGWQTCPVRRTEGAGSLQPGKG